MTQATHLPNKMPWLVPNITVQDVTLAAQFYTKAFNFSLKGQSVGEDNSIWHAEIQYKNLVIILSKEGIAGKTTCTPLTNGCPSSMNLYLYCENIDNVYHQSIAAGATVKTPPTNMQWGDRIAVVADLDGYYWVIATCRKETVQ